MRTRLFPTEDIQYGFKAFLTDKLFQCNQCYINENCQRYLKSSNATSSATIANLPFGANKEAHFGSKKANVDVSLIIIF